MLLPDRSFQKKLYRADFDYLSYSIHPSFDLMRYWKRLIIGRKKIVSDASLWADIT